MFFGYYELTNCLSLQIDVLTVSGLLKAAFLTHWRIHLFYEKQLLLKKLKWFLNFNLRILEMTWQDSFLCFWLNLIDYWVILIERAYFSFWSLFLWNLFTHFLTCIYLTRLTKDNTFFYFYWAKNVICWKAKDFLTTSVLSRSIDRHKVLVTIYCWLRSSAD